MAGQVFRQTLVQPKPGLHVVLPACDIADQDLGSFAILYVFDD